MQFSDQVFSVSQPLVFKFGEKKMLSMTVREIEGLYAVLVDTQVAATCSTTLQLKSI
jgi:hypothetical protein